MRRYALILAVAAVLASVGGCGRKSEKNSAATPVDPLKTAFTAEELGKPLDWKSLSEKDKAFASALEEGDGGRAKTLLKEGATAQLNCGSGCTALMLAAATGDQELVDAMKKAGASETPEAAPYMEVLRFRPNAARDEFQKCLAEISGLVGKKPQPHERAGAYKLDLDSKTAASFIDKHHERLLEKGCYVFLYMQYFGIGGQPDVVLILPTTNKYAVMAFARVNGNNYGIDNFLVIKWMKRLDSTHGYLLTGCGLDFMSGRFKKKISDPEGLAKSMCAFCPDLVSEGTEMVQELARELRKSNIFYFWWD